MALCKGAFPSGAQAFCGFWGFFYSRDTGGVVLYFHIGNNQLVGI